jgi:hypothetical protein
MDKIYVADCKIEIRFAVAESNVEKARIRAENILKKRLETDQLSSFGFNIKVEKITEYKPAT